MKKSSKIFVLLRGLGMGLLTAFLNGLSLPILIGLFIRVMTVLDTGVWPSGPVSVAELWIIDFVQGTVCSLLPCVVAGIILHLDILGRWTKAMQKKWFRICAGMAIGIAVAICYVSLLFYVEPIINFREYGMLAIFILVEQMIMFGWIAARTSTDQ